MDRILIKELVDGLCFTFNQCELDDLMERVRLKSYDDVVAQLTGYIAVDQIPDVYSYLRESFETPDVDLVEVTRDQWSSLGSGVSYVARMGKTVARLRGIGPWWMLGDYEFDSLDSIQQIWRVVQR